MLIRQIYQSLTDINTLFSHDPLEITDKHYVNYKITDDIDNPSPT